MSEEKQEKKLNKKRDKIFDLLLDGVAIIFWTYTITKLFIYDVDIYLVSMLAPSEIWLVKYKFFLLIGIISLIWLFTKNISILLGFLYIIFYPLVLILWKIPYFIFKAKSWNYAIAFINVLVSFFKNIKHDFVLFSLLLIAFMFIYISNNITLLWISIIILIFLLSHLFFDRLIIIFKPSTLYEIYLRIMSRILIESKKILLLKEDIKNLPVERMDVNQLQSWSNNLQLSIILNRLCYFISYRLRDYQKSKINIIFYVLNIFFLLIVTIIVFAFINFGLYKINPGFFKVNISSNYFFYFLYYSVNNLWLSRIDQVIPVAIVTLILNMIEMVFSFGIVGGMLLTLYVSVKSDQDAAEIDRAIVDIKGQGKEIEKFIRSEYNLSIEDAIAQLEKIKAGMLAIILNLSKYIE